MEQRFEIPIENLPKLERKFEKLNNKARALDVDAITLRIGEIFFKEEKNKISRQMVAVYVDGQQPMVDGWKFIGNIDQRGITRTLTDLSITDEQVGRRGVCDHCNQKRSRITTYVLNKNGEEKQVGSTCLGDFLPRNGRDPMAVVNFLQFLSSSVALMGEDMWEQNYVQHWTLEKVLLTTAKIINMVGWIPTSLATTSDLRATRDEVSTVLQWVAGQRKKPEIIKMWDDSNFEPEFGYVDAVIHWASSLEGRNDYERNLSIFAGMEMVKAKDFGFVCSMVSGFEKNQGTLRRIELKKREDAKVADASSSIHVGDIKGRYDFMLTVQTIRQMPDNGWGTSDQITMNDVDDNVFIWYNSKTGLTPALDETFKCKATVKKHDEFRGIKQTLIQRVKIV